MNKHAIGIIGFDENTGVRVAFTLLLTSKQWRMLKYLCEAKTTYDKSVRNRNRFYQYFTKLVKEGTNNSVWVDTQYPKEVYRELFYRVNGYHRYV